MPSYQRKAFYAEPGQMRGSEHGPAGAVGLASTCWQGRGCHHPGTRAVLLQSKRCISPYKLELCIEEAPRAALKQMS